MVIYVFRIHQIFVTLHVPHLPGTEGAFEINLARTKMDESHGGSNLLPGTEITFFQT